MREAILQRAAELGFDECRFTTADPPATALALHQWLAAGQHGEMGWLARNAHKRTDPQAVLPGARSTIVVTASYGNGPTTDPGESLRKARSGYLAFAADPACPGEITAANARSLPRELSPPLSDLRLSASDLRPQPTGFIARYARYQDYHEVLGGKLRALAEHVKEMGGPGTCALWYVDTGPILERDLAQRAGAGFVGKHTNLISRRFGNWILLGEILTTLELPPDAPEKSRCGSCLRCLEACPTRAITGPFQLDARRCLSYLTIELRGPIPPDLRPALGDRIFGCDDCLAVCPWNRFAREGRLLKPHVRPDLRTPDLLGLLALNEAEYRRRFAETPLARLKRRGLRRNVCVALGNVADAHALPALDGVAKEDDVLVAEHARWAIAQIQHRMDGQS